MLPLLARTAFRIQERMLGRSTFAILNELEQSQYWPRERLERLQLQRLQDIVAQAYAHTPYWRSLIDAAGFLADRHSLPGGPAAVSLAGQGDRPRRTRENGLAGWAPPPHAGPHEWLHQRSPPVLHRFPTRIAYQRRAHPRPSLDRHQQGRSRDVLLGLAHRAEQTGSPQTDSRRLHQRWPDQRFRVEARFGGPVLQRLAAVAAALHLRLPPTASPSCR